MSRDKWKEDEKCYDSLTPKEKVVVDILLNMEDKLSDGYGFYCDEKYVFRTLRRVARRMLKALRIPGEGLIP